MDAAHKLNFLFLAGASALLAACGGGSSDATVAAIAGGSPVTTAMSRGALPYGSPEAVASCQQDQHLAGGRSYRVSIPSRVDGAAIVFQVFEPDHIDCNTRHALVLEGHGYGGSRQTSKENPAYSAYIPVNVALGTPIADLTREGFAVISIDERGHGESGGNVRVMDPEYEGQDLIAIVDWATQHLDYLLYRDNNLVLGAMGGSYGGGYQLLLYATDPDQRLDAIAPEITWNDLRYSLNPGGVPKSYWALFLAGAGEFGSKLHEDPMIRSTLLEGAASNAFPAAALPFFNSHSLSYFCDNPMNLTVGTAGDTRDYLLDPLTGLLPLTSDGHYLIKTPPLSSIPKVDALLFQGMRDDLFNFNEAYANAECLKRGGGDVRLLSYEFGHHFISPNTGLLIEGLNAAQIPLDTSCGKTRAASAILAWFKEKLQHRGNADSAIQSGKDVCLSLTIKDAVKTPQVTVGGENVPLKLPLAAPIAVTLGNALPMIVPLKSIGEGGDVLGGIPTAHVKISRGSIALDSLCMENGLPILHLGECDSTVFAGLGVIRKSRLPPLEPELIDEQVTPLRGIGEFDVKLVGVAERLNAGDELVLLLYGFQDGYALTTSRDLSTPVVTLSGSVQVPLLGPLPNLNTLD